VSEIINLFRNRQLNLSPGFQRNSVWTLSDRTALVDSILRQYPLPAIFLYRRVDHGNTIFDVIDGKQRIETILMFVGEQRPHFELSGKSDLFGGAKDISWRWLKKRHKQNLITAYEIPVIEVNEGIADIMELFVRINSTRKALTRQEKAHAKYFNSNFLREANRLANRFTDFFSRHEILHRDPIPAHHKPVPVR
jgi:Protein of unknown function DUF262